MWFGNPIWLLSVVIKNWKTWKWQESSNEFRPILWQNDPGMKLFQFFTQWPSKMATSAITKNSEKYLINYQTNKCLMLYRVLNVKAKSIGDISSTEFFVLFFLNKTFWPLTRTVLAWLFSVGFATYACMENI